MQMKCAVFQICEGAGKSHLVCVEMETLRSAADLESWLRMNVSCDIEVTLLGRFESILVANDQDDAENLILRRLVGVDSRGNKGLSPNL